MERLLRRGPNSKRVVSRCMLAVLVGLAGLNAQAGPGGLYLGVGAAVDVQDFTYGKTVYTEASPGEVTGAESDADQALATLGVFGGYRWQLPGNSGLHLSAEADVAWHPNRLEGHLEGTGYTWTDTWPEDWWLQRNYGYGLAVKLGGLLKRPNMDLYALAGMRGVATEFSITETGCPGPELLCPPTPLASFTDKVDRRLSAWTLGAGLERQLGERLAVQLELRIVDYKRKSWDRLFEGGVVIPSTINGRETGLAVRLLRRL